MMHKTRWTLSPMLDTVPLLHPLLDLDLKDETLKYKDLFTDDNIIAAVKQAAPVIFDGDLSTAADATVMRVQQGEGIHVCCTGYVIGRDNLFILKLFSIIPFIIPEWLCNGITPRPGIHRSITSHSP